MDRTDRHDKADSHRAKSLLTPLGTDETAEVLRDPKLHYDSPPMKRRIIAAAWIFAATVPVVMAAIFLIGCCVLPFHGVMHKLMPLCEMAATVMRGDHGDQHHDHDVTPPEPSHQKQEPVKRLATALPPALRLAISTTSQYLTAPSADRSYRSFISLGAIRCDQDVGLHVLVETYRI